MKKIICLLAALCLVFGLTACQSAEPTPTQAPTAEPLNTAAPAAPVQVTLAMADLYASMQQAVEMPEMLELSDSMKLDYCGVDVAATNQCAMYICLDSLRADEVWLIEAKDEASLANIQQLAQNRIDAKAAESETYSPEQYKIVTENYRDANGLYFVMIVSPDVDALAQVYETAAGK